MLGGHAHDREPAVAERDLAADDTGVAGKMRLPEGPAEHRDIRPGGDRTLLGEEEAAERRLHAERREVVRAHAQPPHRPRRRAASKRQARARRRGDVRERAGRQVVQVAVEWIRENLLLPLSAVRPAAKQGDRDHALRLPDVRRRPQEEAVHETEHGGVGADA